MAREKSEKLQEFVTQKFPIIPSSDEIVLGTGASGRLVGLAEHGMNHPTTGKPAYVFFIKPDENFTVLENVTERQIVTTKQGRYIMVFIEKRFCKLMNQFQGFRKWMVLTDSHGGKTVMTNWLHGTVSEVGELQESLRVTNIEKDQLKADRNFMAQTGLKTVTKDISEMKEMLQTLIGVIGGKEHKGKGND